MTSHRTIGVLISCPHEPYQARIWAGLSRSARDRGIELITFVGTSQDNVDTLENHYFIVGDFISRASLNGLICFGGAVENDQGTEFTEALYRQFEGLPTVLISSTTENLPSVLVENFHGVVALVDHLVQVHHRTQIVFIKGPDGAIEAEERFAGYRYGLEKNGLPFDNRLICPGRFMKEDGVLGVRELLDNNIAFDAVIGADDFTALGALEELRESGMSVPREISVCGFDDESDSCLVYPPLTTVAQPWFTLGEAALDTLEQMLAGETVSKRKALTTELVIRRSCGCFPQTAGALRPVSVLTSQAVRTISDVTAQGGFTSAHIVTELVGRIEDFANLHEKGRVDVDALHRAVEAMVNSFLAITAGSEQSPFLSCLDDLFDLLERIPGVPDFLDGVLRELLTRSGDQFAGTRDLNSAIGYLQEGQALLREYKLISVQATRFAEEAFQDRIRESCQRIITTFVQEDLLALMAEKFPGLDILKCALFLYDTSGRILTTDKWTFPATSRLLLAFDKRRDLTILHPEENAFDTAQIIPQELRDDAEPVHWIMMPVFFRQEHFGFIVFEQAPDHPPFMYEELRCHIGSSIKSASMMDELKIQSMMDELTGVQNRRGFMSRGRKLLESARQAGRETLVFYIDLDGLKVINDTYGHEEGDVAISSAAEILKQTFRRNDVIGRIGGDEFCVILAVDNAMEPGETIMRRMTANIEKMNGLLHKPYTVSLTVGTSTFKPDHNRSLDAILKEADDRLMEKKRARKKAQAATSV